MIKDSGERTAVKTEGGRMHTGDWSAVSVRCPFWRGETSHAICCEGPCRGELVRRIFPNKKQKKDLRKRLCCGDYESCVVYKMVWATYETSGL